MKLAAAAAGLLSLVSCAAGAALPSNSGAPAATGCDCKGTLSANLAVHRFLHGALELLRANREA